jgi:hypothetical protein
MVGVSEPSSPATYIQLELLTSWSADAPASPIVRVVGGPSADGNSTLMTIIDARQGEEIGVLLARPTADNNNYYGLFPLGVFHDLGEGYTNGQLFALNPVSADKLGSVVAAASAKAGEPDCPDQRPERPPEPEDNGSDVQIVGPEVQGQDLDVEPESQGAD